MAQPSRPESYDKKVALVLQGGGALGSYQAGVYEALADSDYPPDWVAGISIGAINAALIAGNAPPDRVDRLRAFWDEITAPPPLWPGLLDTPRLSAAHALLFGQPGFFAPRPPMSWLVGAQPLSFYDTAALKGTLERLVDFDRINAREIRFSVGAVNVRTGNFAYFDNAKDKIRPAHVMASGALPPAFPAVEIDGEFYWDGGMVSNTPLDWVLSSRSDLDTLVLQIDLWSARGALPRDLTEVAVRMKEIQYSSRTRAATDDFRRAQKLREAINDLLGQLPPELAVTPLAKRLAKESDPAVYNIVQLIYRSPTYEGQSKDFEFSRQTMEEHWRAGYRDAVKTLAQPQVLKRPDSPSAVHVFDFLRAPGERDASG